MRKLPVVLGLMLLTSLACAGEGGKEEDTGCVASTEVCNEVDDDCDGEVDEDAADETTVYADDDADGFGDVDESYTGCDVPGGFVDDAQDCNDEDALINPDAAEDGGNDLDEDCDGTVDPTCGQNPPEITEIDASYDPSYSFGGSDQPAAIMVTTAADADGDLTGMAARVWVEIDGDGAVDTSNEDDASDLPTLSSGDEECTVGSVAIQYALSMKNYADETDVVDIAVEVQDDGGNWSEPYVVTIEFE